MLFTLLSLRLVTLPAIPTKNPYAGLADKDLLAFGYQQPELFYPWDISVARAIEMGLECEAIGLAKDKRISNSEGVNIATTEAWSAYGNSLGFIGACPVTRHEISCVLIATENDEMQRDYYYTVACDPTDLESLEVIADKAAERTVRRLGGRRLATCTAPVIFQAEEARSLLGQFCLGDVG